MTNAAAQLAALLAQWNVPPNESGYSVRNGTAGDRGAWAQQSDAYRYLLQVERHIEHMRAAGEDVQDFIDTLPAWQMAVASAPTDWNTTSTGVRSLLSLENLRLLRGLGREVQRAGYVLPAPANPTTLVGSLEAAMTLAVESTDIDASTRQRLVGLIAEALLVARDPQADVARLSSLVHEVGGALLTTGMSIPTDNGAQRAWWEVSRDVLAQLVAAPGVAVLSSVVTAALTAKPQ